MEPVSDNVNPLNAKKSSKVQVKVTLCQHAFRLSPSLITFQFHPLVVLLSEMCRNVFSC